MEINGLGLNFDDYRISMPAARAAHPTQEDFSRLLERTRLEAGDSTSPVVDTGRRSPYEAPIDKNDKLYQLCLELETFLIKNLLTSMRNTVQKSGLVDDSFAGQMYEDMLYDEYAKDFAKTADFGLAAQAYRQLLRYSD